MSSPLQLPPLQQAALDPATLAQLFADLAACAQVRSVQPRTRPSAPPDFITLEEAQLGLQRGSLPGVQIRYRFENKDWCDTLLSGPAGVRLVRICENEVAASVAAEQKP